MSKIILVQTHVPTVFSKIGQEIGSPVTAFLKEYWWVFASIVVVFIVGFFLNKKEKREPIAAEPTKEKLPNSEPVVFGRQYPPIVK